MYEKFGTKVEGKEVTFQLFFPNSSQYTKDDKKPENYGLPEIEIIQVAGSFQNQIGQENWDIDKAPEMLKIANHPKGELYTFSTILPDGFYEYKFYVTFNDGVTRWCNDPCTKYSGQDPNNENSGFVVGGNKVENVKPIAKRLPQKDLIVYEMMIDDFTKYLINTDSNQPAKSRLDLIRDKIKYLKDLGINAVQLMPWTSVLGRDFNWGYEPFLFFSVEDRLTTIINKNNPEEAKKLNKLYRLQELIEALHQEDMHVIMDGVFNHAVVYINNPGVGFPYYWLYRDPKNSPFIGDFSKVFGFQDLNYDNQCTQDFILGVCKYWLEKYKIDGIRFDFTLGYFPDKSNDKGIYKLIKDIKEIEGLGENISLMIEHLTDIRYEAIDDMRIVGATGCWYDPFMYEAKKWGQQGWVDKQIERSMDTYRDFATGTAPVIYIENHDHSTIVNMIDASDFKIGAHIRPNNWFKTQPCAIALLTLGGTVLIHNGQEFGDEYFVPGMEASDRVSSRPVNWDKLDDNIGQSLFGLYKNLIKIRKNHPSLRSHNFEIQKLDESNKIIIYRRWGDGLNGQLENLIIVLNFSATEQTIDIPLPSNGQWKDLLNEKQIYQVTEGKLREQINSNWGRILYK